MNIKLFFSLLFAFSISYSVNSQKNICTIKTIGNKYSESDILEAVTKADWCGYFHENSRLLLTFDDGAIVELFSKKELGEVTLNDSCFQNENTKDNGVYKIHESGILIRMMSARNTSKN
jgi:hypothetical protein